MLLGTNLSIINISVNGLNPPPKDTDWMNGYKNKPHTCIVYRRPTSDLETHTDLK